MPLGNLEVKLKHATFHFEKMKGMRPDDFAFQCHFSAYLASVRSVVVYIEKWLRDSGRTDSWQAINDWENRSLTVDELESWKLITRLRNTDIHEEPIVPDREFYSTISIVDILSICPPFSLQKRFKVTHPKTAKQFEVIQLAQVGLGVCQKLVIEYVGI